MDQIIGPYLFLGKFVWTNGPESSSKVSPYTGIGPWMALPSPCNFNTEMFVSKVGQPLSNSWPTSSQPDLHALLVGEKQYEIAKARFFTQSCSKVGQLLVNSSPTPHPMGSCRGLPCNSPLATPEDFPQDPDSTSDTDV